MEATELKKAIDIFFEMQEQNEAKMLDEANTIESLVELITKDSFGNGFKRLALQKAMQIVDATEDPRVLWHELECMSVYAQLESLRSSIMNRTAVLILKISHKSVPQWFVDLLQNPQHIPEGFLAIVCKKARQNRDDLNGIMSHIGEVPIRTVEKGCAYE